ncbi:MAG: hypothetical protein KDC84_00930 [Crocinitomicaceae bacterium]|nr:hypothetical protein [Crocinitomicaceae bacterium]
MEQFFKKSFYFDSSRERNISVEWSRGCKEVFISENGQELAKFNGSKELIQGVTLQTTKGENLYVKAFVRPFRWEVKLGDRYLINSYNHSQDSLKSTSNIFYFIAIALILILLLIATIRGFESVMWFHWVMLLNYLHIAVYFACGYFLRKGILWTYYVGTALYIANSVWFLYSMVESGNPGSGIFLSLIRGIFIYYLVKAFKHVNTLRKHQQDAQVKTSIDLLDS